ncbi:zinc finger protein [Echinococcus granulosus]|uniref:Zinc finger protein n=1 Tax=Echinococcus granulosus TaxID=6210 RepID=W6URU2_ECHGR|nr:zinc finger protein [Echinococcus granulosus]EUB56129.1 zinc finger protein [Echinococcus granulosus]
MSYSSYEGRLLEVFSHFGMIQKDASEEGEDALISVILKIPKTRLLKDIGQLTEAYLAMQSLNPSNAVNYLSFVTGTLFELVSHPDPDVRMAADEGINQIVKFANIHLIQCVICEVFLEIKRSLHARSLSSALRKFSACLGRINPKKRSVARTTSALARLARRLWDELIGSLNSPSGRLLPCWNNSSENPTIYAVNILPALNGLINREEEMVWDCFAETIEPIAIFIFPHTSQQELITLLLRGLLEKVECDKNYIRRSAATILASSVVHSRLPHELSYLLIQQLVGRVLVLKQRFLSRGSGGMVATAAVGLQGCLCTLRNLASLYSRIPTTALVNERTKSKGRPSPSTYLSASLIDLGVGIADFANWSRESLEFFWWSVVRLLCLQLACRKHQAASSSTMVCTAALECLLEILSSTPAGRPPTELPEGFQEALGAFCSTTWPHSPSAVLHLDDYDSSVDASDADDGSSVTSHSAIPLTSTIVEGEGEKVSLVKRNLLPPTSSTPAQRETEASLNDLPSSQVDAPDGPEFEDENEIVATSSLHSFLGLFAHRFGLLSGAQLTARAAAQSLAVACLAKLSLTLPPELFFEPLSEEEGEEKKAVTGIEMALHLMHHSDPQVRGNACLLVGNILHSTATYALIKPTSSLNTHQHLQIYRLISGLDDLLASEKSGITYRMALKALRSCANTLLHLPAVVSTVDMETESASVRLLQCIAARLVDCARHPYRLVRRETLLLVAGLDWDQLEHLERAWFGRHRNGTSTRLVAATPLSVVAWNECLRLFADADRSLGREAFHSLLALAKRTPSADLQRTQMSGVDLESVDTVAAHLFEHSALTGQNAVACDLPVAQGNYTPIVSGFTDDLRCVTKDLPVYLRFSAPPSPSTQQLKSSTTHRHRLWRHRHIRGLHRVFRELVDSFLELSPVCDSPENRSMMHSLIFGLAELLGRPPITSNHLLWYTPSPFPQPLDEGNENTGVSPARFALQHYQRRPKMALLLWHCISQLAISPLALTDLALQARLLCLASGCALRWGVSSLLEGSIPAGGKMELHHDHAFTRASAALLKHVIKLLAMFWHVFKGVKPSSTASTTSTNIISNFVGGNLATSSVPIASASIGGASASPSTIVTTTITTSQTKSKSIFGLQFVQTTETEEEENRLVLGSRETHGYFADSLEYMQLYNTIRASFEAFKGRILPPRALENHRTMQGSLHYTDLEHRPFNPACDNVLFIDLEYLPPNTPMLTFDNDFRSICYPGIAIPLYIAGPMLVLRLKCEQASDEDSDSFFYDLEAEEVQPPTPENPQCEVCRLVDWLLRDCEDYRDCYEYLQSKSQTIIYGAMKEIWCRLEPKPLLISECLISISRNIDLKRLTRIRSLSFPGDSKCLMRNLDWPTRRAYSVTWMNAIIRAVRQTLDCGGIFNDVACFIFANLTRILQDFVMRVSNPPANYDCINQFYILDAIRRRPITVRTAIMRLAKEVSLHLTHVDDNWYAGGGCGGEGGREDPRDIYTGDALAQGVVENIFVMNMPQLFCRNVSPHQLYVHHRDCQRHPERCPCRTLIHPTMQEVLELEPQVYNPRHESELLHRPFDSQIDTDLYIDLENLPPDTPMMTFGNDYDLLSDEGISIPLFIAGPMKVLRSINDERGIQHPDNFLLDLDYRLIYDPTPYEPQCDVCELVRWLLTECENYGQCLEELFGLQQIVIFEIMREIWCRLRPKPLVFSGRHLQHALRINYFMLPASNIFVSPMTPMLGEILPGWEEVRYSSLEWTNGFMFLIRDDIDNAGPLGHISGFIFANLIRLLRVHLENELPQLAEGTNSEFYVLDAIRANPLVVLQAVMKLGRAVFLTLTALEGDWLPYDTPPPRGFRKEESQWYRRSVRRIVENMLMMNLAELFFNASNAESFYRHRDDCTISPHTCLCRFARFLESTN